MERDGDAPDIFDGRAPRVVRLQLADLVEANGDALLDDARLVRAMLSDAVASARREINLINAALSIGVAERLRAAGGDPLRIQSEIEQLTRQLVGELALHPDAAAWAVRSCAWALHLAPAPDDVQRRGTPMGTPTGTFTGTPTGTLTGTTPPESGGQGAAAEEAQSSGAAGHPPVAPSPSPSPVTPPPERKTEGARRRAPVFTPLPPPIPIPLPVSPVPVPVSPVPVPVPQVPVPVPQVIPTVSGGDRPWHQRPMGTAPSPSCWAAPLPFRPSWLASRQQIDRPLPLAAA